MERGTIQRVSPDFSKRETICTGIRFAVGLPFNRQGDLFCTDQEGATWSPNGNPLDELLHIETGRHYGFPPAGRVVCRTSSTNTLGTLQALTVDACVSPRGDLIVATHGGLPDWGTGPNGKGELWRIR